jgi:nucleoside permease NupC
MLFYMGVIQSMTKNLGRVIEFSLGTTVCESTNAAANIFLGQALAPLVIKPYIKVEMFLNKHIKLDNFKVNQRC